MSAKKTFAQTISLMTELLKIFKVFALFQFLANQRDFMLFEVAILFLLSTLRADFELAFDTMVTALAVTQLHC